MITSNSGRKAAQRKFLAIQCSKCGSTKTLQRHHKDMNPANNREENVEILCQQCHKAEHMKDGTWGQGKVEPAACKVCGRAFQPKMSRRATICSQECLSIWGEIHAARRWNTRQELQAE